MNCELIINKLVPYIDGELSLSDIKAVEEHLSGCSKCEMEFKLLLELNDALDVLPAMSVSRSFAKETVRKAVLQKEERFDFADWWRSVTFVWKAATYTAALAGILVGGMFAKFPFGNQTPNDNEIKLVLSDDESSLSKSYTIVLQQGVNNDEQ